MERSDKIAGSDFGQPQAGPQGGVQGWTPQTQQIVGLRRFAPNPTYIETFFEIASRQFLKPSSRRTPGSRKACPGGLFKTWMPASAGMTAIELITGFLILRQV
jgi:hypothetical protein